MTVKIICDTSADLNFPNDMTLYDKYNVQWVPMQIMFGTEEYKELETLKTSEFYSKLTQTTEHPTTSQSTQADLLKAYETHGKKHDQIISMHISGEISGAVASARMAKKMYDRTNPDGAEIIIYDTRSASTPFGLMVLKAASLAKQGLTAEDIVKKLDEWRVNDCFFYFSVGDLRWLFDGGRLSRAKYYLGSLLSKTPILHLDDGKIVALKSVTGVDNAVDNILEMLLEDLGEEDLSKLTLHFTQAALKSEAEAYAKKIKEKYPELNIGDIFTIGGVITSHTGPGTIVLIMTRNLEY
ncbi:MAG: DegV family protein [Candidatus Heimdallarchaeota archaeon]|nr:DegV family protein [Candidatus Heimdallarchaeota archaeon]